MPYGVTGQLHERRLTAVSGRGEACRVGRIGGPHGDHRDDVPCARVTRALTASGNEMIAALADVVAEVLTGRTTHGLVPATPDPTAVRLHADVAQALQARDGAAAHRAMTGIIAETTASILRTSAP